MTTMFDAAMHDFSTDSAMDADMLPSATSDADWLQVENMMEDGDAQKPSPEEVDMSHGDVQEFEMRDDGDADAGFGGDFDQMLPEELGHIFSTEPQDEEIPDASRAPSPSTLASSQPQARTTLMGYGQAEEVPSTEQELQGKAAQALPTELSTSHRNDESGEASPTHSSGLSHQRPVIGDVVDPPTGDGQDTSTISGESNHSPQLQQRQEASETVEYDSQAEKSAEFSHVDQNDGLHDEEYPQPESHFEGLQSEPRSEIPTENQVTEADDEGLLMDPPPTVLLSYPFDNTRFAFFNLPEDSHLAPVPAVSTLEGPPTDHTTERETKAEDANLEDCPAPAESEHHTQSEAPILLFRERFALYYEPLSLIFEALRADEASNLDGRFDNNIELVISAPELDLTLPEDNIYTREVSLHDLGVLHNGCDLNGPLSLRLDTVSPRFSTRYKAIRDEIVRVVSQQEEEERRSQLDPEDGYVDGTHFHESPEAQVQDEASHEHGADHPHPGLNEATGEDHAQSSEQQPAEVQDDTHEPDVPGPQRVEELEEQADAEAYEDSTSGEYVVYDELDEGPAGDGAEDNYEDAEGEDAEGEDAEGEDAEGEDAEGEDAEGEDAEEEAGESVEASYEGLEVDYYVEELEQQPDETQSLPEEEHVESLALEDVIASLDAGGEPFDDLYGFTAVSGDGGKSAAGASGGRGTIASAHYVGPEESIEQLATSGAVTNNLTDTPELEANVYDEIVLPELVPLFNMFSDAEPLLSEPRSRSRSGTLRPSTDGVREQDEVIAYEDTVDDDGVSPQRPPSRTNPSVDESRAVSTASKRSYDEHELDQLDGADPHHGASSESKRLRVD